MSKVPGNKGAWEAESKMPHLPTLPFKVSDSDCLNVGRFDLLALVLLCWDFRMRKEEDLI